MFFENTERCAYGTSKGNEEMEDDDTVAGYYIVVRFRMRNTTVLPWIFSQTVNFPPPLFFRSSNRSSNELTYSPATD